MPQAEQVEPAATADKPAAPRKSGKRRGLAGCGSYLAFKLIAVLSLAGFGLHQANEAGVELDVFLKQPALAAAAIGVMAHGDFEFVSLDKYRGTLTLRQTANGQVSTLRPEQVLRGDVMESGRRIGQLLEKTGTGSGLPAWLPSYPGARSQGVIRQDAPGVRKGVASYEASATVNHVVDYYNRALRDAGFTVSSVTETPTVTLSGSSEGEARTVQVAVTSKGLTSSIRVTFTDRE